MSVLNDKEITELCNNVQLSKESKSINEQGFLIKDPRMITPFTDSKIDTHLGNKIPSYGLGSFSYDVRLARNFKVMKTKHHFIFNNNDKKIIDLREGDPTKGIWEEFNDVDYITIPPHGFALGTTIEKLNVPEDIYVICMAKSTLARAGLMAHVTPIENGWCGYITIELSNLTSYPMIIPSNIGIMALIFLKGKLPLTTYNNGKYQNQDQLPIEATNYNKNN